MAGSVVEQQLQERLPTHAATLPPVAAGGPDVGLAQAGGSWVAVLAEVSTGVWRSWFVPVPVLLEIDGPDGNEVASTGEDLCTSCSASTAGTPAGTGVDARLRACLVEMGLGPEAVELFATAAATSAAVATGGDLADVIQAADATTSGIDAETERDGSAGRGAGTSSSPAGTSSGEAGTGETGVGESDLAARTAGASRVLGLAQVLTGLTAHLEGTLVAVVGDLTVRNGRVLLARKGVAGPGELTENQAKRWRARAKSVTRGELEAATGWGPGEVADLVALANAPATVREPVLASMLAGVTPWRLARRFLRELGHHAHEDTAQAAIRLFGTDPAAACTDRLDPDGNVKDGPWEHPLFRKALAGEATRLASRDPQAAAAARQDARSRELVKMFV